MKNIFLVDMDDTLLDFKKAERANLKDVLSSFSLPFDEEIYSFFHEINDSLWKALERGEIEREPLKVKRFELLLEKFGLVFDAEELSRAYFSHFASVCYPFPGAVEFLKELQRRGRTYIVSNGGIKIQEEHIRLAGFSPYLCDVFLSERIGANKPSKDFAEYVETHIPDYSREHAVWIGDSLTSDGECAKRRGIDFILFSPDGAKGYAGYVARDYSQVLSLLSPKN